jgi:hypothetical protein
MNISHLILTILFAASLSVPLAPADRNAVNTKARPGGMMADSPVTFPKEGALPAKYPPDVKDHEATKKMRVGGEQRPACRQAGR